MADKKNKSVVKKPSEKKPEPAEPTNVNETIKEALKRIKWPKIVLPN